MPHQKLGNVVVQKLIRSRNARAAYRFREQRRPIGEIDLSFVTNTRELHDYWKINIGECGRFALLSRDSRGRFGKCIAVIEVTQHDVIFERETCSLATYFRNANKRW